MNTTYQNFKTDFYGFNVARMLEKFSKPITESYKKDRGSVELETYQAKKMLAEYLNICVAGYGGKLPDCFFADALELAKKYVPLNPGHCEQYYKAEIGVPYSQLYAMFEHSAFIGDARCLPIVEELTKLTSAEPWHFNFYVDYVNSSYVLRSGFGKEQLPGFLAIVNSEAVWSGKSGEARRVLLSSISEACEKMEDIKMETFPIRLKIWFMNWECSDKNAPYAELKFHTVYSFDGTEEKETLRKIANIELLGDEERKDIENKFKIDLQFSGIKAAADAVKILGGYYKNMGWAI